MHALLAGHRLAYPLLVVVGGVVAGDRTLQQPVIALRVEQTLLVETGRLETMIHVRCDDEIVALVDEAQQVRVRLPRAGLVAEQGDHAAPKRPAFLRRGEGVEAARVGVRDTALGAKVSETLVEDRARVMIAVGCG